MSELRPLTLDLAENARYSLHYLSHNLDPEYKWYTCFKTFYEADPPYHQHTLWDHCEMPGRYLYGIVFARQLVGPDEIKDAEKKIKKNLYRQFDCPDGLCHRAKVRYFGPYPEFPPQDAIPVKHDADMWDNRSVLMGVLLTGATEGDKVAMKYARGMVKGRLPIFEFFVLDNEMREKVTTGGNEAQLRALSRQKGYGGLLESGVAGVLNGLTTAEEVLSVTFKEDVRES